jgi:hypothetical protein
LRLDYAGELGNLQKHLGTVKNEVPQVKEDETEVYKIFAQLAA